MSSHSQHVNIWGISPECGTATATACAHPPARNSAGFLESGHEAIYLHATTIRSLGFHMGIRFIAFAASPYFASACCLGMVVTSKRILIKIATLGVARLPSYRFIGQ
jgi:hypothetical protein